MMVVSLKHLLDQKIRQRAAARKSGSRLVTPFHSGTEGCHLILCLWRILLLWFCMQCGAAELVSLASYNLENYLLHPNQGRKPKPIEAKAVVQTSLLALRANVLALQELGSEAALVELKDSLADQSLNYPHHAISITPDSPIHVGLLSQFPIRKISHHVTNVFVLYGKPFRPSRGFLEVDLELPRSHVLKVFVAHLKSKRPVGYADQWDLRTREALLLRSLVDARLKSNPNQWVAVVGDFNDGPSSQALKFLRGRQGQIRLYDARPSEGKEGKPIMHNGRLLKRSTAWTHFFQDEDLYSRVDFILMNRSLNRSFLQDHSYVLDLPNWGIASDHRPVLATFELP